MRKAEVCIKARSSSEVTKQKQLNGLLLYVFGKNMTVEFIDFIETPHYRD